MAQPRIAVFPGSFDPPTLGHLDVIRRAARLFDTVIVAILENTAKQPYFSVPDRLAMLRDAAAGAGDVRVEAFSGLLTDFARRRQARTIVRGIRGSADLEYERQMAETNHHLNPDVDTVFLVPSAAVAHISSTLVREIASLGGSVSGLVPPAVEAALAARDPSARAGTPGRMQRL